MIVADAVAGGGTVTCNGCPPNPSACYKDCIFTSPQQYALNGVLKMMDDPAQMKRIVDASVRLQPGVGYGNVNDPFYKSAVKIGSVDQKIDFQTPTLIRSAQAESFPVVIIHTNCGPGDKTLARVSTDKYEEEIKTETEKTTKSTKTNETTIDLKASYGQAASAEVNQKATSMLEETRRDLLTDRRLLQHTLQLSDDIKLPPNSYDDESVDVTNFREDYEVIGVITSDTQISFPPPAPFTPGRWSDFSDEAARQNPVKAAFSVPYQKYVFHHDIHTFDTPQECLTAASKM
jgi:hypothetical protein